MNELSASSTERGNIEQLKRFERSEMILLKSRVDGVIAKRKKPQHLFSKQRSLFNSLNIQLSSSISMQMSDCSSTLLACHRPPNYRPLPLPCVIPTTLG